MSEKLYEVVMVEDDDGYRCRTTLEVRRSGKVVRSHLDGGEPEDNSFGRDWSWVVGALREAYAFGLADGRFAGTVRCTGRRVEGRRMTSERRWGYASSRHEEVWTGALDSREAAIEEARETFDGEPFWIVSGHRPDPAAWCPDLTDIIEDRIGENAYDNAGELAEDWPPVVSKEARAELQDFAKEWVRKYMPVSFWIADGGDHEQIDAESTPSEGDPR